MNDLLRPRRAASWARLGLLTSLYLAQGLPYGFFIQALPVVMRKQGLSLELIGSSSLLALPWGLKFLWAPLVDKHVGSPLGARRGWILPLQITTTCIALGLAFLFSPAQGGTSLLVMAGAVLLMNLLAATQDIATDGLAVDVLEARERGLGNGVQVAAYRIGMILGGGALVSVFDSSGWRATFSTMAGILAVTTVPILLFREEQHPRRLGAAVSTLDAALAFLRRPGVPVWLLVIATYKLGDALPGPMARTMLVDGGYTLADIGLLFGTWGSAAGFLGALLGGLVAQRAGRRFALVLSGLVHAALLAAYAWPASEGAIAFGAREIIAALVVMEHLTGGMATVALFTSMMDVCDPRTGATDYTVQACVIVAVQVVGSVVSGLSSAAMGYGNHFVVAGAMSALGVWVMAAMFSRRPAAPS